MAFFSNITNLAELKKVYRKLAFQNHPDLGGSTTIMQQINSEFEHLFNILKDGVCNTNTGYENDYAGASASQYADYVYNEYRWKGSNYNGQRAPEIVEIIRKWLKETYPGFKFSVTRNSYDSIYVYLLKANFNPWIDGSNVCHHEVNHYYIDADIKINDRAKDVLKNIKNFVMSYNYDESNAMIDYFNTNFYFTLGIGNYKKPFEYVQTKLSTKDKVEKQVKEKVSPEVKAIKKAMGTSVFSVFKNIKGENRYGEVFLLGDICFGSDGSKHFWPKHYPGLGTAIKRMNKLREAGIKCKMFRNFIMFDGFAENICNDVIKELNIFE